MRVGKVANQDAAAEAEAGKRMHSRVVDLYPFSGLSLERLFHDTLSHPTQSSELDPVKWVAIVANEWHPSNNLLGCVRRRCGCFGIESATRPGAKWSGARAGT